MIKFFKCISVYFKKRKSVIRPFIKTQILQRHFSFSRAKIRTARSNSIDTRTRVKPLPSFKEERIMIGYS